MKIKEFFQKNANIIFFVGGFIFDSITLVRIDSALDLLLQFVYLSIITALILLRAKETGGKWAPSGLLAKVWHLEAEVLHFCYGGLLSGYVIFYFKSTSFSRSLVFLSLIAFLMIANEMPQVKRLGFRMRLGLHAFCVVSYLNYLLPVLIGRMGWWVFALAWVLAAVISWYMVKAVAKLDNDTRAATMRLSTSPAFILLLVMSLYTLKLIPPVPLSLRHLGIYRAVDRQGDRFKLMQRKPPWYLFWQTDDRVFPARPGDDMISFVSVFGPRRFSHSIYIHWMKQDAASRKWHTSDRVPIAINGGRDDGYRGFSVKENYDAGVWRVDVETEDGRVLGSRTLLVTLDTASYPRKLKTSWL